MISLCMIVKDEESSLANCLDAISSLVDEIIIVDTGSSDKTKEVALKYTDKVYDYSWNNNFAAARNYSISRSCYEFILVIDSDEIVESIDLLELKKQIEQNPNKVGRLLRINEYSRSGIAYKYTERVNRLFSKNIFNYEGMIHEQVMPINESLVETYNIPLIIKHSGYEGDLATRKKKTERNIKLLTCALKENPGDPYILYQIGKSCYMEEDYSGACIYFEQVLCKDLDARLEYVQDMVESYGYSLLNSGQYEIAIQLLNVYDKFSHSADFIFMIALVLMNNGKFQEAIEEFIKATKKTVCKMEGVNGYLSYYNIGIIYECLGDKVNARKYYIKCGDYDIAKQRIDNM